MLQAERYQKIESLLAQHSVLSISELQAALNTSRATIYRDLKNLDDAGRIQIVRGGATLSSYPNLIKIDEPYSKKVQLNTEEKKRIAHYATSLVKPGMTIVLDSSTTVFEMCRDLLHIPNLQIITNDLRIATEMRNGEKISVFVTGGFVRPNYYTLSNYMHDDFLQHLSADISFMACDAITIDRGCMITNSDEIPIKKEMLSISRKHILLSDHSKFGKTAFCCFAPVSEINIIICGNETPDEHLREITDSGINIVTV